MYKLIAAVLAAVALTIQPAMAQQGQPAAVADADFSAEHLALAQEVIDLTRSDRGFDDILPKLAEQTRTIFTRANPALTREIETVTMETALSMAQQRVELNRTLQLLWARRFTIEQLRELKAFFASPVGTQFVELTPVITALSVGAARQWEERMSADMLTATRAKLREMGYSL